MSLAYDTCMKGQGPRNLSVNFHDSLGFILYDLKAKLEANGETVKGVTINGSTTDITVDFTDIDVGFANDDSAWEEKLADSKIA